MKMNRFLPLVLFCGVCPFLVGDDIASDTEENDSFVFQEVDLNADEQRKVDSFLLSYRIFEEAAALPFMKDPQFQKLFEAIELDPSSRELMILLLAELKRADKLKDAGYRGRMVKIAGEHPEHLFPSIVAAELLAIVKEFPSACTLLEEALKRVPEDRLSAADPSFLRRNFLDAVSKLLLFQTQMGKWEELETMLKQFPERYPFLTGEPGYLQTIMICRLEELGRHPGKTRPLPFCAIPERAKSAARFEEAMRNYVRLCAGLRDFDLKKNITALHLLCERGYSAGAKEILLNVLLNDPRNLPARVELAGVYSQSGEYANAIRLWQNILLETRNPPWVFYDRYAEAAKKNGTPRFAIRVYEMALLVSPNNPSILAKLAQLLMEEKMFSEALLRLNQMPPSFQRFYWRAITLDALGRTREAIPEIRQAAAILERTKIAPEQIKGLRLQEATYAERIKDHALTDKILEGLLKQFPDDPMLLNYLGYTLADRNVRLDEAEKLLKRALALEPDRPEYLDSFAWLMYRKGDYPQAKHWIRKCLDLMEKGGEAPDPVVADHAGDIYLKCGESAEAVKYWSLALEGESQEVDPAKVRAKIESITGKATSTGPQK